MIVTKLLSIDPGEATGWSLWHYDAINPLQHLEHGTVLGGLHGFIPWFSGLDELAFDEVVIEEFILDGRTLLPNTMPLEVIGAVEMWCFERGHLLARQRNTFKAAAPDHRLKEWGLWWPGKGHDRDSARHALAYMRSRKHMPTISAYWPDRRAV